MSNKSIMSNKSTMLEKSTNLDLIKLKKTINKLNS